MEPDRRIAQLIELGRDREAVALAAAAREQERSTMDVMRQLDELGPLLLGVVGATSPEDLRRPTPCDRFDVAGILEHMVQGATAFAAAFRGEEAEPGAPEGAVTTGDVRDAFGPALLGLAAAIGSPGALERRVMTPMGELPGDAFARFVVLDGLVHGWDIAVATGQAYAPSDELVAAVEEFARTTLTELRDGGETFADAVVAPADATPIDRLAAFTGRRVAAGV